MTTLTSICSSLSPSLAGFAVKLNFFGMTTPANFFEVSFGSVV